MAAALMMLIFFLTFLASNSGEPMLARDEHGDYEQQQQQQQQQLKNEMKTALGSRPPRCINKCMNCRPCYATLVVPPHHKSSNSLKKASPNHYEGDGTYYLLSWKCRCRNKLFQP